MNRKILYKIPSFNSNCVLLFFRKTFIFFNQKKKNSNKNQIKHNQEPNEIDQIYRVLKQAGELSSNDKLTNNGGAGLGGINGSSGHQQQSNLPGINLQDIPMVSEPDYPERVPGKQQLVQLGGAIFNRTQMGTNERSKLAVAQHIDVSSSGAE